MDEIAEAIAGILGLSEDLARVFEHPPESVSDYPCAIVLEVNGREERAGIGGLWEANATARVWILARPRRNLPEDITAARPWVGRLLTLFEMHDELAVEEDDEPLGEITRLAWKLGNLEYAGIQHAGVELEIEMRLDRQVVYGCGPVAVG